MSELGVAFHVSSLNLQPSLPIIVVQAGVFLANMYAVKKLMLEPFLKVHAKRQSITTGATNVAKSLTNANEEALTTIGKRLDDASSHAGTVSNGILEKANREKDEIINKAEKEARERLAQVQAEVRKELENQRREIPRIVASLSDEAFSQVIA